MQAAASAARIVRDKRRAAGGCFAIRIEPDRASQAIVALAEIRMADEIDAAQERGEIATPKDGAAFRDPIHFSNKVAPPKLKEVGVKRQDLYDWRQLRDAGGGPLVEAVVEDQSRSATRTIRRRLNLAAAAGRRADGRVPSTARA